MSLDELNEIEELLEELEQEEPINRPPNHSTFFKDFEIKENEALIV